MRTPVALIALCAVAAGVTAYALSPGSEEQLAMLARDGRNSEASIEFARLMGLGRQDPAYLAAAARALESTGNRTLAQALLERYVADRPGDVPALDWLAALYQASNDATGAIRTLAALVAIAPTRVRVSGLLDLYRSQERIDEERELLKLTTEEALLRPMDVERLGILLSWAGDRAGALTALRRADAIVPKGQELGRIVLFDLLLASGLSEEAAERAGGWIRDWSRKPWLGVHIVRRMAAKGDGGRAVALGADVIAMSAETRFYLARVVAEDGNRSVATALLDDWARGGTEPSSDEVAGYVAAAGAVGDLRAIWRKASMILAEPEWAGAHIAIAEALALRYGITSIAALRPRLSWAALRRQPLFSARLAVLEGNPVLARRLLDGVEPETLPPSARAEWVALLSEVRGDEAALAALADLRRRVRLPADLIPIQLRLAQRLGNAAEQVLGINELRRQAQVQAQAQAQVQAQVQAQAQAQVQAQVQSPARRIQ